MYEYKNLSNSGAFSVYPTGMCHHNLDIKAILIVRMANITKRNDNTC